MKNKVISILAVSILSTMSNCKSTPDVPGVVETRDVNEGWDGDTLTVLSLGRNTSPGGSVADQKKSCAESAKSTAIEIAWQKNWLQAGAKSTGRARYMAKRKVIKKTQVAGIDFDPDFNCQAKVIIKR